MAEDEEGERIYSFHPTQTETINRTINGSESVLNHAWRQGQKKFWNACVSRSFPYTRKLFVTALLYSFFLWFKPSEPYLVQWLIDERGFTEDQVYQDIFPIWTYSYFVFLLLIPIGVELFQSHVAFIIIGSGCLAMGTGLLLIPVKYTTHPWYLYVAWIDQIFEGIGSASNATFVALLAHHCGQSLQMYNTVSNPTIQLTQQISDQNNEENISSPQCDDQNGNKTNNNRQRIFSLTRSMSLISSVLSALLGALLFNFWNIQSTMWLTLVSMIILFVMSVMIPPPPQERKKVISSEKAEWYSVHINNKEEAEKHWYNSATVAHFIKLANSIWLIIRIPEALKWALYKSISTAVHQLSVTYIQSLFAKEGGNQNINGYIYATAYTLAAIATLIPTILPFDILNRVVPNIFLLIFPILSGTCLIIMGTDIYFWLSCICWLLYHSLYEFLGPIASVMLAGAVEKHKRSQLEQLDRENVNKADLNPTDPDDEKMQNDGSGERTEFTKPEKHQLEFCVSPSFSGIFSATAAVALFFQSMLQFAIGKEVLDLSVMQEYLTFGIILASSSVLFVPFIIYEAFKLFRGRGKL